MSRSADYEHLSVPNVSANAPLTVSILATIVTIAIGRASALRSFHPSREGHVDLDAGMVGDVVVLERFPGPKGFTPEREPESVFWHDPAQPGLTAMEG
mgnify:CR=1 FL=1